MSYPCCSNYPIESSFLTIPGPNTLLLFLQPSLLYGSFFQLYFQFNQLSIVIVLPEMRFYIVLVENTDFGFWQRVNFDSVLRTREIILCFFREEVVECFFLCIFYTKFRHLISCTNKKHTLNQNCCLKIHSIFQFCMFFFLLRPMMILRSFEAK